MPPDVIEKHGMEPSKNVGLGNTGLGERICDRTGNGYGASRKDPERACYRARPWAAAMTPRLMARPEPGGAARDSVLPTLIKNGRDDLVLFAALPILVVAAVERLQVVAVLLVHAPAGPESPL